MSSLPPGAHDPYVAPQSELRPPQEGPKDRSAAALTLGLIGLVAWLLPIVGLPVTIIGLSFGLKSLALRRGGTAIAGVALCLIGLTFSVGNMALGIYLATRGQHGVVNVLKEKGVLPK